MSILISVIGAVVAITVSAVSAFLAHMNNIKLQIRKMKEEHYIDYIEKLHNYMVNTKNNKDKVNFVLARDKLLIIADENVIKQMSVYEEKLMNGTNDTACFTELIKAIRMDLKLGDKDFPKELHLLQDSTAKGLTYVLRRRTCAAGANQNRRGS